MSSGSSTTRGVVGDSVEKAKLNIEMSRWGINYRQLCGLDMPDLIKVARAKPRRAQLATASKGDDSVAKLLFGYLDYSEADWDIPAKNRALRLNQRAEKRNPRAKVRVAQDLLNRRSPTVSLADAKLRTAREQNCAYAFYVSGSRAGGRYPEGLPAATGTRTWQQYFERAAQLGSPSAMCALATARSSRNRNQFRYDWSTRERYLRDASATGANCGKVILAAYGEPGYYLQGEPARGPCASNRACIVRTLRAEFAKNPNGGWIELYNFLRTTRYGGSARNNAEAVKVLERAGRENGNFLASNYLGESYAYGYLGLQPNPSLAYKNCNRAALGGDGRGAACTYFVAGKTGSIGEVALRKTPCVLAQRARDYLPRKWSGSSFDIGKATSAALVADLVAMNTAQKGRLRSKLDRVEWALSETGKTTASCAAQSRAFLQKVKQVVRPHLEGRLTGARRTTATPRTNSASQGAVRACSTRPANIFFDYGVDNLGYASNRAINDLANRLKNCSYGTVTITGHDDQTSDRRANQTAIDRVVKVRNALVAKGVAASKIRQVSKGNNAATRASGRVVRGRENRRVYITIAPAPASTNQRTTRTTTVPAPRPPARSSRRCNRGPYIVFFDWRASQITADARNTLTTAINAYRNCGTAKVTVAGHTDRSITATAATRLSADRANTVRNYLARAGRIPASRISTLAYGATRPRVQTPAGRRELQNRRVEITFGP
ncbi:MAG: OmpA family protein [Pseudomonadota bacterium]|nr:OmpA family protein [Pseudomonadota bacterium]